MNATQLIKELGDLVEEHGDGEVTIEQAGSSSAISNIDVIELGAATREFMLYSKP